VLASDQARLEDLMISPVVTADAATLRNDLMEIFDKYQYRMIPVVDAQDHILGVIRYKDVMKSPEARARE
jgi:Mg/Co/Ni transporter MgtE